MKFAPVLLLLIVSSHVPRAFGQNSSAADFDDLARRATAALEREPQQAATLYAQALAIRPDWAEGWFYLGASQYELKRFAEARDAFVHATSLASDNSAAWAFLGLCEDKLGDDTGAIAHIVKAESLGLPDRPSFISTVRLCAAEIYMRLSSYTLAIDQLRPLAKAGDDSAAVIRAFGVAALTLPYPPPLDATHMRELINLAGRAAWNMYAGRPDAASLFEQLAAKFPREPGVHYLRGVYEIDRDPKEALAEFRKELQISPAHAMARVQIVFLQLKSGEAAAALEPAREAVKLDSGNFLCHVALGRVLLEADQTPAAIGEFQAAVKLAPDYAYTHFYLGQAYRQAGRIDDAKKEFADFNRLKLSP